MKKLLSRLSIFALMNAFALMLVARSVNTTCFWEIYQPEVPEGAKKFMKLC